MVVVVSTVSTLNDLAAAALTVAEDALTQTDEGTPDLAYVSPGRPADRCCPVLTVHVDALSEELTSPLAPAFSTGRRTSYGRIILATLVVRIMRCAPEMDNQGNIQVTDAETKAAQVESDAFVLMNAFRWAIKDGTFEGLCNDVHFDSLRSVPSQGGCVGFELTLRAEIGGMPSP